MSNILTEAPSDSLLHKEIQANETHPLQTIDHPLHSKNSPSPKLHRKSHPHNSSSDSSSTLPHEPEMTKITHSHQHQQHHHSSTNNHTNHINHATKPTNLHNINTQTNFSPANPFRPQHTSPPVAHRQPSQTSPTIPASQLHQQLQQQQQQQDDSNWFWGAVKKAASSVVSVLTEPDDDEFSALFGLHANDNHAGTCPEGFVRYRCGTGDTFAGVAARFHMNLSELIKVNQLNSPTPYGGQIINVRAPTRQEVDHEGHVIASGENAVRRQWSSEILKAPAWYSVKGGKIGGHIVLTSSSLVFDADAQDKYILAHAMPPFQLHVPITSFAKSTVIDISTLSIDAVTTTSIASPRHTHPRTRSSSFPSEYSNYSDDIEVVETHNFEITGPNVEETVLRLHTRIHVLIALNQGRMQDSSHPMTQAVHSSSQARRTHSGRISRSRSPSPHPDLPVPVLDFESEILSQSQVQMLVGTLPISFQFSDWFLLYSLQRHGVSLGTFFRNTAAKGPSLVIIQDQNGHIFGGYASESWEIKPKYYGTGESYLFQIHPHFHIFSWSKKNEYFMLSSYDAICMGGGGHYGFSLDKELLQGSSDRCDTFDSPCLASGPEFQCMKLEVWGFQKPKYMAVKT